MLPYIHTNMRARHHRRRARIHTASRSHAPKSFPINSHPRASQSSSSSIDGAPALICPSSVHLQFIFEPLPDSHGGRPPFVPGPPAAGRRTGRRGRARRGSGLRLLLPRPAVARELLRHQAELLLPQVRQAGGGLRHPRPLAQPRRRLLPAELQPRQRLQPVKGERPAEQPPRQVADAGVPLRRRAPLLGPRVGETRHLRRRRLRRARLLPGRAAPPRPARRPRRARRRRRQPRRRLLHAGPDQGRHQPGHRVRALRRVQPRRGRQQPALPALLLRRRRRRQLHRLPRPPLRQAMRQQDRVPGVLSC